MYIQDESDAIYTILIHKCYMAPWKNTLALENTKDSVRFILDQNIHRPDLDTNNT